MDKLTQHELNAAAQLNQNNGNASVICARDCLQSPPTRIDSLEKCLTGIIQARIKLDDAEASYKRARELYNAAKDTTT